MITPRLSAYICLERQVLALDAAGDCLAEDIRDVMDTIWYALNEKERKALNERVIVQESNAAFTALDSKSFYITPTETKTRTSAALPTEFKDWKCAA